MIKFLLLISSFCIFGIGIISDSLNVLVFSIFLLILFNLWYSLEKFSDRIVFLSLNITIFVFLLGRPFVIDFFNYLPQEGGYYGTSIYELNTVIKMFICIYLSLLSLYVGHLFIEKYLNRFKITNRNTSNSVFWTYMKNVSKYLFYFLIIFRIIYIKDQANFIDSSSYFDFYTSYHSNLPYFVVKLAEVYSVPFFAFLALKPSKREVRLPVLVYFLEGVFQLSTGRRSGFMLNIIIILIYFALRNKDYYKKWLGKREIFATIISLPILLSVLNLISYRRQEITNSSTFYDMILEFFYKQGVTLKSLFFSDIYNNLYPENRFYSLGTMIEYFKNNAITQFFIDSPIYTGQTVERALNGNLFSHRLTYFISPNAYLQGRGYGSSYIAELYVDFGFIGVIIGSILLGILIVFLTRLIGKNPIITIFSLLALRNLLVIPRTETTAFITSTFTLGNIIAVIFIFVLTYVIYQLTSKTKSLGGVYIKNETS